MMAAGECPPSQEAFSTCSISQYKKPTSQKPAFLLGSLSRKYKSTFRRNVLTNPEEILRVVLRLSFGRTWVLSAAIAPPPHRWSGRYRSQRMPRLKPGTNSRWRYRRAPPNGPPGCGRYFVCVPLRAWHRSWPFL